MHTKSSRRFLFFVVFVLGAVLSTANEGEKSRRGLYDIASGVAQKISGFASEYTDTAHVDCENCVHITGLPGCVQSSIFEASRPIADADICLTLKVGFTIASFLPDVPGEVRMGIRAPLTSPLRLWRYSIMDTCKDFPPLIHFFAERFGTPSMHIKEVCGCDRYMCNKYVGLFDTHPVFQI